MTRRRPAEWIDTRPGERGSTPVLLLHGFLGCAEDWSQVIATLGATHRCVAFDLPGHGAPPEPLPAGGDSFERTVDGLADRMSDLGFDRFHVLGYSMGGRLALGLVCRHPGRIMKAVAVGGSAGLEDESARAERLTRDRETASKLETGDLAAFLRDWYAQPLFRDLARHESFASILERRLRGERRGLAAALRGLGPGAQPPLHRCLAQTKVPLLLIAGGADQKYVASNRALAEASPRARALEISSAGHSVHLERPDELARIVAQFFVEREGTEDG